MIMKWFIRLEAMRRIKQFRKGRNWALKYLETNNEQRHLVFVSRKLSMQNELKNEYFERGVRCGFNQFIRRMD